MSSPVHSPSNPFSDPPAMAESPRDARLNSSNPSSAEASGLSSVGGLRPREKKRVGFTSQDHSDHRVSWAGDTSSRVLSPTRLTPPMGTTSPNATGFSSPTTQQSRQGSGDALAPPDDSRAHLPQLSPQQTREIHEALNKTLALPKPRSAIRRSDSNQSSYPDESEVEGPDPGGQRALRRARAKEALERGRRLAEDERARSEPNTRSTSLERPARAARPPVLHLDDIPLEDFTSTAIIETPESEIAPQTPTFSGRKDRRPGVIEMDKLSHRVPWLGRGRQYSNEDAEYLGSGLRSGAVTPIEEKDFIEDYKPQPELYRGGVLGSLLKLYGDHSSAERRRRSSSVPRPAHLRSGSGGTYFSGTFSASSSPPHSPGSSGTGTPTGYFPFMRKHKNHSTSSLAHLVGSSASMGSTGVAGFGEAVNARLKDHASHDAKKQRRGVLGRISRPRLEDEIRIKFHIAETIARQKYLLKLCRALMMYGAPTHRLEEYMNMSARVLEIQAQFLYIPGSMIMSFDDPSTHTTEVKLVRCNQGLDLGKLRDVHEVYKEVVHDRIGVDEATARLKEVTSKKDKHSRWFRIPIYGLAAVSVGPFAFGARFIDLPIAFILGCILGFLQLVVAPRSDLYANVFEIAATVITSFLARAFGSIRGGDLFCFSALAQSSIALILPGYMVLCASLELQSKSLVAGSVRMVYAIIYSLFLGYGITIGAAIYGIMDHNATSEYACKDSMEAPLYFIFVPIFTMCLIIINQAKWKQAPVMVVISCVGYLVNFYSSRRFAGNTQVSNTLGALAIGVMANLYSRIGAKLENFLLDVWEDRLRLRWRTFRKRTMGIREKRKSSTKSMEEGLVGDNESLFVRQSRRVGYGLAAAAMLPAIFVQVPSGLAVQGSLISGIASADQIAGNSTNGTTVANVTNLFENSALNNTALTVGYSVIQIAIGITVGLFLSAIVVYPLGKRRSGLFSF